MQAFAISRKNIFLFFLISTLSVLILGQTNVAPVSAGFTPTPTPVPPTEVPPPTDTPAPPPPTPKPDSPAPPQATSTPTPTATPAVLLPESGDSAPPTLLPVILAALLLLGILFTFARRTPSR